MVIRVLFSWVSQQDLDGAVKKDAAGSGPIAMALESGLYKRLVVLSSYDEEKSRLFCSWIEVMFPKVVTMLYSTALSCPDDYSEIYTACDRILQQENTQDTELTFHLSSGNPATVSIWILLASGKYRARLIETHQKTGCREIMLPFDAFAPYRLGAGDTDHISAIDDSLLPERPAFDSIIHSCEEMKRSVAKAKRAAVFEVPVLLLGEKGTGKKLLARAIHNASTRSAGPFIAVNCAAIQEERAESAFWGEAKGFLPESREAASGYLEKANGGTLFLDEVGELSRDLQLKLLRVVQNKKLRRSGEATARDADFRLISATSRNLAHDAAEGRFLYELFHTISVGIIKLPPLRERGQDLSLLAEHICSGVNREFSSTAAWRSKSLSAGAVESLYKHFWPGNISELKNTLIRAIIFSGGTEVDEIAIQDSLIDFETTADGVLDHPLGEDFSIEELLSRIAVHYLERAMKQAGGNKTRAAKFLGLNSYQTLGNWLERYGAGPDQ